jgi:hypothetical protein
MDEIKRIIREIADTQVEIRVCERLKSKGVVTRGSKPVIELLGICERKLITLNEQLVILKKPAGSAPSPQASQVKKPAGATTVASSTTTKKPSTASTATATKTNSEKKTTLVATTPPPSEAKKPAAVVATIAPQPLHQKRPALVAVAVAAAPPIIPKRPVLVVTAASTAATGARAAAHANNLKKPALVSAALVPPRPVRK